MFKLQGSLANSQKTVRMRERQREREREGVKKGKWHSASQKH
jgi:hypothetical protein